VLAQAARDQHQYARGLNASIGGWRDDRVIARRARERQGDKLPMTRLAREGRLHPPRRCFPTQADPGVLVRLPGGETGHVRARWHPDECSEWGWQAEFDNHRSVSGLV
jgi:hypothetical protein